MTAILTKEVEEAPFHKVESPHIMAIPKFQPKTAQGKLKAVITAISPRGFHYSTIYYMNILKIKYLIKKIKNINKIYNIFFL